MSRLAYLETLARSDDEYKTKYFDDTNISKAVKEIEKAPKQQLQRFDAVEKEITEVDWPSIAFNTYLALNPYVHPVARLRSGLKVAEELTFIDEKPLDILDALEQFKII